MLDIYTKDHRKTGKTFSRGERLAENEYSLAACTALINSENECLITQRHPDKQMGLMWELPGGAVEQEETSLSGALREFEEEVGVRLLPSEIVFIETIVYQPFHLLIDTFIAEKDIDLQRLTVQPSEVIAADYCSYEHIKTLYNAGKFTPFDFECCQSIYNYLGLKAFD